MRLLIVEDHPALARGLALLLGTNADIAITAVCMDAASAAEAIGRTRPDVVLCDVMLQGRDAGFDLLAAFGTRTAFLMYSAYDFPAHHARAIAGRAAGFVSKTAEPDVLLRAIRQVAAGGRWFPSEIVASARSAARPPTGRESELLALLAQGASNDVIATRLGIRVKTVEGMFRRLFDRYDVGNRTQLVQLAQREGWLTSGAIVARATAAPPESSRHRHQ
jgi:DNA-binding NarL/FixJ family response regulator